MKKSPIKTILAFSVFAASIFLSSCSSSIKSESNPTKISADKKEVSFNLLVMKISFYTDK